MRDQIAKNLSAHIDASLVTELLEAYEELIAKHRAGDHEGALIKAGRFVELTLRSILYIRNGTAPDEIKSVAATVRSLENDTNLPEPLRLLIPRVLYGMIYTLRSKRDAVHVKEIDPRQIDVAMAVSSASWVIAELLRLYHVSDERDIEQCMLALSRTSIPYIESVDGETIVARNVKPQIEMLLLLANACPDGMTRRAIGIAAKCSPSSVSTALKTLEAARHVHRSASNQYFITSAGEAKLSDWLAEQAD